MENNNLITIAAIQEQKESGIDMENLEPHSECCIYKVPKDLRRVNEEAYTPQMENNNLITIAAIEEGKESRIDMENLEPHSECCIYRVPKDLRRVNAEAYTPQIISIGPLHHDNLELLDMEMQKIRYKREFSQRIIDAEIQERLKEFINHIEMSEQRIRNCYKETLNIQKLDFITMILYDAIFIIELLMRHYEVIENDLLPRHHEVIENDLRNKLKKDFLLSVLQVTGSIFLDLQLLENQLPYFILDEIYMLAFPKPNRDGNNYPAFFSLSCKFFGLPNEPGKTLEVKHFVDLRRSIIGREYQNTQKDHIVNFPSANKLQESGVKFKGIDEGRGLLDIKFEKKKRCNCIPIPCLEIHELKIPHIEVNDETESLFRNVMALEQCYYPYDTLVCNYVDLMDNLINTEEDVNLLIDEGIISNQVGDTVRIKNMFNNLGLRISLSCSCYYDIVSDLKAHYENPWNHVKATLKRVYFSNLWRGTATVAAIVLLLFTLIQTICTILQVT